MNGEANSAMNDSGVYAAIADSSGVPPPEDRSLVTAALDLAPGALLELGARGDAFTMLLLDFLAECPASSYTGLSSPDQQPPEPSLDPPRAPLELRLLSGDPADVSLVSAAFDRVVGRRLLTNRDDPAAVTAEALRLLRPGGVFACLEPLGLSTRWGLPSPDAELAELMERIQAARSENVGGDGAMSAGDSELTATGLTALFAATGFVDVRAKALAFTLRPSTMNHEAAAEHCAALSHARREELKNSSGELVGRNGLAWKDIARCIVLLSDYYRRLETELRAGLADPVEVVVELAVRGVKPEG